MSCPNATAPIDISISKITNNCSLKCSYRFKYNDSSCNATNRGEYISISYDKSSSPPVIYNAIGYDVQELRLYTPSLHSYNETKTDGELIVVHTSNTGSKPLLVCVPIKGNNTSSDSALFFKTLIDTVASNAPAEGDYTAVNVTNFNLEILVPKKPFYSYSATEPYNPCTENVDYIVFSPVEASLDIMPESLKTLQSIIKGNPYSIKTGAKLFYNEKGPSMGNSNGQIYIDCQPVGSSDDTVEILTDTGIGNYELGNWLKNPFVKLFIASVIFIILLYGIKYSLNFLKPEKGGGVELLPKSSLNPLNSFKSFKSF
jgi:carbonic anhydrase